MRALVLALAAILTAGCTVSAGALKPPATAAGSHLAAVPSPAASPIPSPTPRRASPRPSPTPVFGTSYTTDDEKIAKLIEAGVRLAIPQLRQLNKTDPSRLVKLFEPVGTWIATQEKDVAGHVASACTAAAVELYLDGLDQYDAIRKEFLAWKDWGAHGHAYPPGAPMVAVKTLEGALVELEATCPD